MDPEIQALVEQLSGGGASIFEIAMGTAPQTGLLVYALVYAWKRIRDAEEKLDAILKLCQKLSESGDSTPIVEILEGMVTKNKSQHDHNRWVQRAILKLFRKGNHSDSDVDELELTTPEKRHE